MGFDPDELSAVGEDYALPPAPDPVAPPPAPAPAPAALQPLPPLPPQRHVTRRPSGGARAKAGATVVLCAVSTGVGAALGGYPGAGAGLFLSGAVRNLYRAQAGLSGSDDSSRGEAAKSLTLGVLGLAAGGYFVYRCFRKDK